jgi:hypothetical protein
MKITFHTVSQKNTSATRTATSVPAIALVMKNTRRSLIKLIMSVLYHTIEAKAIFVTIIFKRILLNIQPTLYNVSE